MNEKATNFLVQHIRSNGPMDVGSFMTHVLCHPEFGYYTRQDPFGVQGDFITAPEISQIFGELIGAWVAGQWMQMGSPASFMLIEVGPGRGTLMADALRATKHVEGFHQSLSLHLLEASPSLKEQQQRKLAEFQLQWHDTLDTVPTASPMIIIGNEFLDALPIRQVEKVGGGWVERVIVHDDNKNMFSFAQKSFPMTGMLPPVCDEAKEGDVYEFSPARESFVSGVCERIKAQNGAALFIDYGHVEPILKDSFRAFRSHSSISVFDQIGDADLTADVDFSALISIAQTHDVQVLGPITQGEFLESLGLFQRAQALAQNANAKQKDDLEKAVQRLHDPSELGGFKVIGFVHG